VHAADGRVQVTGEVSTDPTTHRRRAHLLLLTIDEEERRGLIAIDRDGEHCGSASEATAILDRMAVTRLPDALGEWLDAS
jgi:type II secretory pathway predicted ATPase ExeA